MILESLGKGDGKEEKKRGKKSIRRRIELGEKEKKENKDCSEEKFFPN